jgi:hypothetical protein
MDTAHLGVAEFWNEAAANEFMSDPQLNLPHASRLMIPPRQFHRVDGFPCVRQPVSARLKTVGAVAPWWSSATV